MKTLITGLSFIALLFIGCKNTADKKGVTNNDTSEFYYAIMESQKSSTAQFSQHVCEDPNITGKRDIQLQSYVLEQTSIADYKRIFRNKLKIKRADGSVSDFEYIQEHLTQAGIDQLKGHTDSSCNTWPGVKIHYGLDTMNGQNRFRFIYEPVNLVLSGSSTLYDSFWVQQAQQDLYYITDAGNTLNTIAAQEANQLKSAYKDLAHIYVTDGNYLNIQSNNYPKAIIFPFEEIDKVIEHNAEAFMLEMTKYYFQKNNFSKSTADSLKYYYNLILNSEGIVFDCGCTEDGGYWKQHAILSPVFPRQIGAIFSEKGADLGGLCPPNCPKIFLRVE